MNILLVEDDAGLVELITTNLEELGFSVVSAISGSEALEHLAKQIPYLMLLDYSLPDINGKELIETLNTKKTPPPPFIITTGQGDERIAVNMMKLGAKDYLVKDILFLEKLPDVVKRVVKEIESDNKLKQAEEALIENEVRFRAFMNASNDITFIKDDHFRYLFANEKTARFFNTTLEKLIGKTDEELAEKTQILPCRSSDKRALESNEQFIIEEQLGNRIFEVTKLPLQLPNNKKGIGGIMKDITERVLSEHKLKDALKMASDAEKAANLGSWKWHLESNSFEWSDNMCRLHGIEPTEYTGEYEQASSFQHPDDIDYVSEQIERLLTEKEAKPFEYRIITAAGDVKWIEVTNQILFDEKGEIKEVVGTVQDISERKEAERLLQEHSKAMENTESIAKLGGWSVDLKTMTPYLSKQIREICELDPSNTPPLEEGIKYYAPEDLPKFKQAFEECIKTGKPYDLELRFITAKGNKRWVRSTGKAEKENGEIIKLSGVLQDITERKIAEEELKENEESLKEIIQQTSSKTGQAFFNSTTKTLGNIIKADYTFIGKYIGEIKSVETISLSHKGKNIENFAYELKDTPCDNVINHGLCVYKSDVANKFPNDILLADMGIEGYIGVPLFNSNNKPQGILVAMFKNEIEDPHSKENLIQFFASRTETELERYEIESSLRESEERFKLAMAATKDSLFDFNLVTNEIYYSPVFKSKLGYKEEELANDVATWEKVTRPEDMEASWTMQQEVINKQRDRFEIEIQMQHKDGHWIDILTRADIIFDENGTAIRMVGTNVDITERKREEKILDAELKLFEYAINHSEEELLQKFLDEAEKLTNSEIGFYHYVEDDQESISLQTWSSNTLNGMCKGTGEATRHYPISEAGVWVDCIKKRTPVIHNDYASLTHKKGLPDGHAPIIRELVVPVIRGNEIMAVLGVGNKKSDYNETDVKSVQRLADVAWETIVRKQAEEKIRITEESLKKTFNISPSIITKLDAGTGYFIEVNQAVTRILGHSIEEFTSRPVMEFIHPDDRQRTTDEIADRVKGGKTIFFENRYLCTDGSYKWISWHATKADKNGIITANGSDITERKKIEQEINNTKQFYENIIEGVQDGIWVTDKNDVIFYANLAMENIAGVPRKQIQGKNILKDFPKETIGEFSKFYKQAKKEKKPVWYVIKAKTPGNKNVFQNGWLIPQYKNRAYNGVICTVRDISDRKEAERSVRRLSTAVEQSPSIVVITDPKGKVEYVNPKFTELTGYSSTEVIGEKSNILKSGEQDALFYEELWETVLSEKVWRGQFRNKKKNGELFWEAASISAILNDSGNIINFIKIGEDITQQKNTESKLKTALEKAMESDRLKSAFLANMSHEIRTPMNGILGFINLLNEPNLNKDQIDTYSKIIDKSGKRLLTTINDIIDISKIEAGQMDVTITETSLNNELNELYSFHSPEANLKGLSLIIEPSLSTEQVTILTDNHKFHGVLTNLIKNAIKYTDKGSISFGYFMKENFIEFFVKDTGIGIPKNRLQAVFNRFEQADIEDVKVLEGSGLGLAISKAYVEMLGGEIFVKSEEGKGSKFSFTIPYVKKEEEEEEEIVAFKENSDTDGENTNKLNLLIVEDDEVSLELLKYNLEGMFKDIISVDNGKDAIEICRNNPELDLVLMDIKIPIINGYDATKEIRTFNRNLLIIAQTAYTMAGDKEKAIKAGCNDYISKPINKNLLLEIINKHIRQKKIFDTV